MDRALRRFAKWLTDLASHPVSLVIAMIVVGMWFIGGFFVDQHFENTNYQLLINTGTTIVTFWLGFAILVQAARETRSMMLKLDELIVALSDADDRFVDLEDQDESELIAAKEEVKRQASNGD